MNVWVLAGGGEGGGVAGKGAVVGCGWMRGGDGVALAVGWEGGGVGGGEGGWEGGGILPGNALFNSVFSRSLLTK